MNLMDGERTQKQFDEKSKERFFHACEEYFKTSECIVTCDECAKAIEFRQLSRTVWEHFCSCGKFNGTLKGL